MEDTRIEILKYLLFYGFINSGLALKKNIWQWCELNKNMEIDGNPKIRHCNVCKMCSATGKSSNQKLLTQLENACGGVSVGEELSSDVFDGFWGLSGRGVRKWVGKKLRKKGCGCREWSMMVQPPLGNPTLLPPCRHPSQSRPG